MLRIDSAAVESKPRITTTVNFETPMSPVREKKIGAVFLKRKTDVAIFGVYGKSGLRGSSKYPRRADPIIPAANITVCVSTRYDCAGEHDIALKILSVCFYLR